MKHHNAYTTLFNVVYVASLTSLFFALLAFAQDPQLATVSEVKGKAFVKDKATTAWRALTKGNAIRMESAIKTSDGALVKVKLPDASTIEIAEKTELKITKALESKPGTSQADLSLEEIMNLKTVVDVAKGRANIKVTKASKPAPSKSANAELSLEDVLNLKMIVKTKSATVGVHGTEFTVISDQQNAMVVCKDGQSNDLVVSKGSPDGTDLKSFTQQFTTNEHIFVTTGNVGLSDSTTMVNAVAAPTLMAKLEGVDLRTDAKHSPVAPGLRADMAAESSSSAPKIAVGLTDLNNLNTLQLPKAGAVFDTSLGAYIPDNASAKTDRPQKLDLAGVKELQRAIANGESLTSFSSPSAQASNAGYKASTDMSAKELSSLLAALITTKSEDEVDADLLAEALSAILSVTSASSVSNQDILINQTSGRVNDIGISIGVTAQ